jgi:hypothetical protein
MLTEEEIAAIHEPQAAKEFKAKVKRASTWASQQNPVLKWRQTYIYAGEPSELGSLSVYRAPSTVLYGLQRYVPLKLYSWKGIPRGHK